MRLEHEGGRDFRGFVIVPITALENPHRAAPPRLSCGHGSPECRRMALLLAVVSGDNQLMAMREAPDPLEWPPGSGKKQPLG
jgi:hypothetical protein